MGGLHKKDTNQGGSLWQLAHSEKINSISKLWIELKKSHAVYGGKWNVVSREALNQNKTVNAEKYCG